MTKFKITVFGSHFPPQGGGGITSSHANLFYALKERGCDVTYIAFQENNRKIKKNNPPNVFQFGSPLLFKKTLKASLHLMFRAFEKFDSAYQTADILHSTWGALASKKMLIKNPTDFWILPDQSTPLLLLNPPPKTKVIYFVHHHAPRFLELDTTKKYSKTDTHLAVSIEKKLLKNKINAVVCPSESQKNHFLKTHPHTKNIFVIPNLLNTKLILTITPSQIKKELNLNPSDPLIYIPGAHNPLKGAELLPELLSLFSNQYNNKYKNLNINKKIGFYCSGGLTKEIENKLKKINNNFYFYTKKCSYFEHLKIVNECDFGISPTLMESFGMAILEALCLNTPMIAFNQEATSEVITADKNGILIPFMDLKQFSEKLSDWVINRDTIPSSPEHLGKNLLISHEEKTLKLWDELFNKI